MAEFIELPNGARDALGRYHHVEGTESDGHTWFASCTCGWKYDAPFGEEQIVKAVYYHLFQNGLLSKAQVNDNTR